MNIFILYDKYVVVFEGSFTYTFKLITTLEKSLCEH